MRKTVEDFTYGAECVFRGMRIFYTRPKLWPYALPPILCVLLLYAGVMAAIFLFVVPWSQSWFQGLSFPDWLSWLHTVLNICLTVILFLAGALLMLVCLGAVYEMFGGLLFDYLLDAFEKEDFPGHPAANLTISRTICLSCGFVFYAIMSALIMLLLLPVSFLIPVAGPILFFMFSSIVYGVSYLSGSSIRQGAGIRTLKKQMAGKRFIVLGFGATANFLLMIPFFILVLMPGLVIGGSILYHTRLLEQTEYSGGKET